MPVREREKGPSPLAANLRDADAGWALSDGDVAALDALTTDDALATARAHYLKRRAGTAAPWGDGLRPRLAAAAATAEAEGACPA